jgi:branched-chain amino acid transport system ATP-binding protein
MDMVMSICNPITVMSQGKLLYQGDAEGARHNQNVLDAYLGDLP